MGAKRKRFSFFRQSSQKGGATNLVIELVMTRCQQSLTILGLVLCLLARPAVGRMDWPRFRGPNGSGISDAQNLPIEFGPGTNLAWKTAAPEGISSPIVCAGQVFLTGFEGSRLLTWCLDFKTGQRIWEQTVEAARTERKSKPNDAASSTPVTDGTNVYALFSGFGLVAYSVRGDELWRRPLGPFNPPHGMASSPILVGASVIVVADQVTDSHIVAFDAASGREQWRTPRGNFVGAYTTPVLVQNDVVISGPIEMIGYSTQNGHRVWSIPRMGVMPVSSPVCQGNAVFAYNDAVPPFESLARELKGDRNGDGKLEPDEFPDPSFKEAVLAIDRSYGNGDGAIDQKEWDGALHLMSTMNTFVAVRLDGAKASELWRTSKMLSDAASPLLYRNVLYLIRNGGILSSVDPDSGAVLRQERVTGFEGIIYASPVAADGKIFLANGTGKIAVIAVGGQWQTLAVNDLHEGCYATPAPVEQALLVRSEHALWAFKQMQIKADK
jgi:outer membrane protein assembly factor BamB